MADTKQELEYIGASVKEHQEARRAFIKKMTPKWQKTGAELRRIREQLKISQKEISDCIGASVSVIERLEHGLPIRRRIVIETTYRMTLRYIPMRRKEEAGLLKNI